MRITKYFVITDDLLLKMKKSSDSLQLYVPYSFITETGICLWEIFIFRSILDAGNYRNRFHRYQNTLNRIGIFRIVLYGVECHENSRFRSCVLDCMRNIGRNGSIIQGQNPHFEFRIRLLPHPDRLQHRGRNPCIFLHGSVRFHLPW